MAGDWFPIQYWRSRCPEIVRVSSTTGRGRHEVLGLICDFWSWVSTESADGSVRGVFVSHLPEIVGGDAALWAAFVAVGWVGENAAGIIVPGWNTWLCESAKKRMKEAKRKANKRAEQRPKSVRKLSASCPESVRGEPVKCLPTEQDRTEEKKSNTEDPPTPLRGEDATEAQPSKRDRRPADPGGESVPIPPEIDCPRFRTAWTNWLACRRAKGKRFAVTARAAEVQLRNLLPLGIDAAIACVEHSIANGYQGLFPEKYQRGPPKARGMFETHDERILNDIADANL